MEARPEIYCDGTSYFDVLCPNLAGTANNGICFLTIFAVENGELNVPVTIGGGKLPPRCRSIAVVNVHSDPATNDTYAAALWCSLLRVKHALCITGGIRYQSLPSCLLVILTHVALPPYSSGSYNLETVACLQMVGSWESVAPNSTQMQLLQQLLIFLLLQTERSVQQLGTCSMLGAAVAYPAATPFTYLAFMNQCVFTLSCVLDFHALLPERHPAWVLEGPGILAGYPPSGFRCIPSAPSNGVGGFVAQKGQPKISSKVPNWCQHVASCTIVTQVTPSGEACLRHASRVSISS
jgi:hypothetical protein